MLAHLFGGQIRPGDSTGGKIFIKTNMMTAAMAPVITKVTMVVPMILPARWRLSILATEPAMEANTRELRCRTSC